MSSTERGDGQQWAVAIGVFDGVHRGHQDLIGRMRRGASRRGVRTACVTFDPDPELVVRPARAPLALSSVDERTHWLRELGVDHVEVIHFTQEVAHLSPEAFIGRLLERFQAESVWVGSEFAFGHQRAGDVETLCEIGRRYAFKVESVDPLTHDGHRISSSWIRTILAEGNVTLARELLGRPYSLTGTVGEGMQRGRQLGFPTANVVPPPGRVLPSDGVYVVDASVLPSGQVAAGQTSVQAWPGVVNLGPRPTFAEYERLLETHLLDFQGDLYGRQLEVRFLHQIRGVTKFESIEALRQQIGRDIASARELSENLRARDTPRTQRRH